MPLSITASHLRVRRSTRAARTSSGSSSSSPGRGRRCPKTVETPPFGDPWTFKDVLFAVPMPKGSYIQREALLHLVHPDTFESIVSRGYKEQIATNLRAATDDG